LNQSAFSRPLFLNHSSPALLFSYLSFPHPFLLSFFFRLPLYHLSPLIF
jgi:hypothetical protein